MWEPSQATLDIGFGVHCGGKGYRPRVRSPRGEPKGTKRGTWCWRTRGQQYGNMATGGCTTIARTPRTCFEIWSGDHRQTPGGLQQTEEAKKFRRKLLKRPLALRCPTQYIQPHGLADVVARYLEGHPDSPQVTLASFLQTEAKPRPALGGSNLGRFGRTGGKSRSPPKCRRLPW